MKCPKCHRAISDNATICPYCHKVLALECPNCHSITQNPICENCGYIILTKCNKCGRTVSTTQEKCKCGFPTSSSLAFQECETDEFASVSIKFLALKSIRRVLGSQELFTKFYFRLKNLLTAQLKSVEGRVIIYNDTFVINFNKELSLPTSVNKAVRLAIKIANAFSDLNLRVIDELGTPLRLNIIITKKNAENLLKETNVENNVKLLNVKKEEKTYLKGMQIILDQYTCDCISKDYKTDSLYTIEEQGQSVMFYEIILDNYILPPSSKNNEEPIKVNVKELPKQKFEETDDKYSFKVFDINAKCKFKKANTLNLIDQLDDSKIIALRSSDNLQIATSELFKYYESKGLKIIHAVCTEELSYKPWGLFQELFKDYYGLSLSKTFIPPEFDVKAFQALKALLFSKPRKAGSPEDARFAYMEDFGNFLASLKNCVIIVEGFEFIDDTSIQTLELYFDKFKKININFVFVTESETSLHSKIKGLLRTEIYTEYVIQKTPLENILSTIKEEASDFINSFYFEKIKDNYDGSLLYYNNAIKYLTEKGILVNFENRLLIRNNASILLPNDLKGLLKARLKFFGKNPDASMILAYSVYLGPRIDYNSLETLGIKDVEKNAKLLENAEFLYINRNTVHINNYNILKQVLESSLKRQVEEFLCKNILAKLGKGLDDTLTLLIMGKLEMFKEEYLLLWRNSQLAMSTGDFDTYLKNCLGFLSLIEHIENNISEEDINNNKKEVFQNILMTLYSYSPEKIYSIEKVLLMDAINENDNDKIVKLSNLMLQGALISSNYTDALSLLHNILSRMEHPTLLIDGAVNTKFLLLSLINIEILFNIGDFVQCVETTKDLCGVLRPEILEKIKPASFSLDFFVEHISETFRLAGFAKLFLMDEESLDEFFAMVETSLGRKFEDKDVILAVRDFLAGKEYASSNIEKASAFSKVIYLILLEFAEHHNDYKLFAQNIYQAKLLAADIHELQLEQFCDLLIAYSYANIGLTKKAAGIYQDVLEKSEHSAIFNILVLARYFMARLRISESRIEEALLIINDILALLQKYNNQAKVLYVLFEKLFIDTVKSQDISAVNIESEEQKLVMLTADGKFSRLMNN